MERRRRVVAAVLGGMVLVLAARLFHLHVIQHERLSDRANRQRSFVDRIPAPPGDLLDRHGRLLATTVKAQSFFIAPDKIGEPWPLALRLSQALQLDPDRLCERLMHERDKKFLWIKRRLSPEEETKLRELHLPADEAGFRDEYLRRYPQGALAAHAMGLRDIDGHGRGGLEQSFEEVLRGQDGRRTLLRDARGRVVDLTDEQSQPPRRGADVTTTLDSIIQLHVERELESLAARWKPLGACALVQDPRTGEILAMASWPAFDPNNPEQATADAWINRAIAWVYEPGSTFKPFIVAGALEHGVLDRGEEIACGGEAHFGSRVVHDTHHYDRLSVADVLAKSSNIGMARIAQRLTKDQLQQTLVAFGFGRPTGLGLAGELSGLLRPMREWSSYTNASLAMGQELTVTPLQLISAHSSLANGGTLISPKIVMERAANIRGERALATPIVARATDHGTARWLVTGPMTDVVRCGTGTRARIDGYAVFGKTGTAQKLDPQTGTYSSSKYVSSFLCGAPAGDPRVMVLVVVDEPSGEGSHYGGTVAAPAAREILSQALKHLGVPPEEEGADDTGAVQEADSD